MTVINDEGETVLGVEDEDGNDIGIFRSSVEHESIIGWAPFFQHTSSRKPRGCISCHPSDDSAEEQERVKGVYGFGTGEFMLDTPDGGQVDALQFLHPDGAITTPFVHPGSGPLSMEVISRALAVEISE